MCDFVWAESFLGKVGVVEAIPGRYVLKLTRELSQNL